MAGLEAAGYQVFKGGPTWGRVAPDDVLVIWNRYGDAEQAADRFEVEGGRVIVAENGYLNKGGGVPKFDAHEGRPGYYALALSGHNGSGTWLDGGPERWWELGIDLKPWRTTGDHILVCSNRPFGSKVMQPPQDWEHDVTRRLRKVTKREIRIRPHPGNTRPKRSLEEDLHNCWACVIWASSAGLHALVRGIPVVCESPRWICKSAAFSDLEQLPRGGVVHRRPAFHRLAWAQWAVDEIASGIPFKRLLCTSTPAATSTA